MIVLIALFSLREDLGGLESYLVSADEVGEGDVFVRYMGNTNLYISDGETAIMTDAWFTRPSFFC